MDDGEHMLTTVDNPWDPWTRYDDWRQWDIAHGYNSESLLARVCNTSDDLSDADQSQAIEEAITTIVTQNVSGVHVRAPRSTAVPALPRAS